jgi:hypothetical protein
MLHLKELTRAMRGFEYGVPIGVVNIAPRGDSDPANLGSQGSDK